MAEVSLAEFSFEFSYVAPTGVACRPSSGGGSDDVHLAIIGWQHNTTVSRPQLHKNIF